MPTVRSVRDLRVYQLAFSLANRIFDLSKAWPKEERYALTDQVRRSSRSICANLSEAWAKRPYPRHFVSKLTDAEGVAIETQTWVAFAEHAEYLTPEQAASLHASLDRIIGSLVKMRSRPEAWCPSQHGSVREDLAQYFSEPPS